MRQAKYQLLVLKVSQAFIHALADRHVGRQFIGANILIKRIKD
jgi:hypothetical protein